MLSVMLSDADKRCFIIFVRAFLRAGRDAFKEETNQSEVSVGVDASLNADLAFNSEMLS